MIKRIAAVLFAVLGFMAMFWRGQAKQSAADAKHQGDRADAADNAMQHGQQTIAVVEEVENKQREERIDAEAHFDNGDRNQLDNRW